MPPFSMGVEEEYLLVDLETRNLVARPDGFFHACQAALGDRVAREFYRAQIEVATRIHTTPASVRDELSELRETIAAIGARYGIGILAASMHPFARQSDQEVTPRHRYLTILDDLAMAGRRLLVCGMHVHVGVEEPDERIAVMNQMRCFVPHLIALSTSSPFFEGEDTGMNGYRLSLYQSCPRTGLPPTFGSHAVYTAAVDQLVQAGVIEDASKIWWDVRPSARFPTVEMRAMDMATRVEDAASIAALYGCLVRHLVRMRRANLCWREPDGLLLAENRWRAMRYGVSGTLFDPGRGALVSVRELVEDLVDLVSEDADELGCDREIQHLRRILAEGTSADRQRLVFERAREAGLDNDNARKAVVDYLRCETIAVTDLGSRSSTSRAGAAK